MKVTFEDCSEIDPRRVGVFEHIKDRQEIINLKRSLANEKLLTDHWRQAARIAWEPSGPTPDFKPLTFWRAVGLITLGAAFGASFVLFGLPKAHAQDYRMPGYEAPPIQYQPLTPPNSLSQGEPQSFSIIPDGLPSQGAVGQPSSSGTIINNDTGAVLGTYQVTP